jgi:plasmid stabilization system protein ParE
MTEYILHREADEDLVVCAHYLRRENPEAAVRFLDRAFEAFDFIARWPEASPLARFSVRRHRGIRFRPLPRPFQNYLVFYQIRSGGVHIYRVLHGATNWRDDLELFG